MKLLFAILLCSLALSAEDTVLRVKHVTKSNHGTEAELLPMLPPRMSAYVEMGTLKEGEVIQCKQTTRYTGRDEHGDTHRIVVLKCGEKVLLLKGMNF